MQAEDLVGKTLARTYLTEALLGHGGMGAVYRARHLRTGGVVAVKILKPEQARELEILRRFHIEAKIIAELRHPHIVRVVDFYGDINAEDIPAPFLVMDLLEGEDLHTRLKRVRQISYEDACKLMTEVGSALQATHNHDIVHRDIKPQNLFIHRESSVSDDEEVYKVVDFGISKIQSISRRTPTLMLIGTPQYMAPEAAISSSDAVDSRSDQFSLAVVLYRALSGRAPFDGDDWHSILYKVIHHEPPALATFLSDIPIHASQAVERAMRKDKAARFPTIMEFVHAFLGTARSSYPRWRQIALMGSDAGATVRLPPVATAQAMAAAPATIASMYIEQVVEESRQTPFSLLHSSGQAKPKPWGFKPSWLAFVLGGVLVLGMAGLAARVLNTPARFSGLTGGRGALPADAPAGPAVQPSRSAHSAPSAAGVSSGPSSLTPAAPEASNRVQAPVVAPAVRQPKAPGIGHPPTLSTPNRRRSSDQGPERRPARSADRIAKSPQCPEEIANSLATVQGCRWQTADMLILRRKLNSTEFFPREIPSCLSDTQLAAILTKANAPGQIAIERICCGAQCGEGR